MKKLLPLLLLLSGCTATNKGNGSFFFTYGTTIEFGSRTQVADQKQVSSVEVDYDKIFGFIREFTPDERVQPTLPQP